ncbi:hypothetical protein B0H19DRAFT_151630 [Mycena capillaripes]|nr:hypothetical protein B0H19DRAFT_151630 [Mycena capillaripes]
MGAEHTRRARCAQASDASRHGARLPRLVGRTTTVREWRGDAARHGKGVSARARRRAARDDECGAGGEGVLAKGRGGVVACVSLSLIFLPCNNAFTPASTTPAPVPEPKREPEIDLAPDLAPPRPAFLAEAASTTDSGLTNLSMEAQVGSPPRVVDSASTLSAPSMADNLSTTVHTGREGSPHPVAPLSHPLSETRTSSRPSSTSSDSKFVEGFVTPTPTPGASDPPAAPLLASGGGGGAYVSSPSPFSEPSGTTEGIPAPPNSLATTVDSSQSGAGVKLFSGPNVASPSPLPSSFSPPSFSASHNTKENAGSDLSAPSARWEQKTESEGPSAPQNSLAAGAPDVVAPTAPSGVLPAGSDSGFGMGSASLNSSAIKDNYPADVAASFIAADSDTRAQANTQPLGLGSASLNSDALKDTYPADTPASFIAANATPTTQTNATPTTQTQTFGLGSASLNSSALKDNYPADTPADFVAANPDVHGAEASKAAHANSNAGPGESSVQAGAGPGEVTPQAHDERADSKVGESEVAGGHGDEGEADGKGAGEGEHKEKKPKLIQRLKEKMHIGH